MEFPYAFWGKSIKATDFGASVLKHWTGGSDTKIKASYRALFILWSNTLLISVVKG